MRVILLIRIEPELQFFWNALLAAIAEHTDKILIWHFLLLIDSV